MGKIAKGVNKINFTMLYGNYCYIIIEKFSPCIFAVFELLFSIRCPKIFKYDFTALLFTYSLDDLTLRKNSNKNYRASPVFL